MNRVLYIKMDKAQLADIERELSEIPHGVERVLTRAVNKVATAARTQIVRRVAQEITVGPAELRRRNILLTKANYRTLAAWIHITGHRIPLMHFAARQTRSGTSWMIRRGARKRVREMFIATMASGHRGVFAREPKRDRTALDRGQTNPRGQWLGAYPIVERYGPSVPQAVEDINELSRGVLDEQIALRLYQEAAAQVELVLARHGRSFQSA